jgi:hypothetical protein
MTAVWVVMLVNAIFALFFLIRAFIRKNSEQKLIALVIFFTPLVGLVCYVGQYLIRNLSRRPKEIPLDEVGFDRSVHERLAEPDVEAEMQAVPLEELFLVSADVDKRKGLLTELKKESAINYGAVAKALDIEDPESSHYAAAALANAKAEFENELRDFDNRYHREPDNVKLIREYAAKVRGLLASGILAGVELKRYHYLNMNLLQAIKNRGKKMIAEDYEFIVKSAFFNKEYGMAEEWAVEGHQMKPTEDTYLNLLRIYYDTGRTADFIATMDELKQSDVDLSEKGLNLVRFYARSERNAG